jgi:hypothetical protein
VGALEDSMLVEEEVLEDIIMVDQDLDLLDLLLLPILVAEEAEEADHIDMLQLLDMVAVAVDQDI